MSSMSTATMVPAPRRADERFESLLALASAQGEPGDRPSLEESLATLWKARNVAKDARLRRCGEADLGIGMTLVELERVNEGIEAVRRACRFFAEDGKLFLRGCAHLALAEISRRRDEDAAAQRDLLLAADLLTATGQSELARRAFERHASDLAARGHEEAGARLRAHAKRLEAADDGAVAA